MTVNDWTSGEERLCIFTCDRCTTRWYLPRQGCPNCGSVQVSGAAASGNGVCVARTELHVTADSGADPVVLVLVDLEEGPVAMGRAHPGIEAGDRVQVEFRNLGVDRAVLPVFRAMA